MKKFNSLFILIVVFSLYNYVPKFLSIRVSVKHLSQVNLINTHYYTLLKLYLKIFNETTYDCHFSLKGTTIRSKNYFSTDPPIELQLPISW